MDYIRSHEDFRQSLFFPRNSMIDFVILTVKPIVLGKKGKDHHYNPDLLEKYLKYCFDTLTEYHTHKADSPDSTQNYRIREAVLLVVGHLSEQVHKISKFFDNMPFFLEQFVVEGLRSDVGFIRSRCAWVLARYDNIDWKKLAP